MGVSRMSAMGRTRTLRLQYVYPHLQTFRCASGRFALIAGSRAFTLVPWRDDMARHLGRELDAKVGSGGISWSLGRGRGGPEIG